MRGAPFGYCHRRIGLRDLSLPRATREPLLLALPVLVAVWALAGFYGSLGPMLVHGMLGSNAPLLGGLTLFTSVQ